MKRVILAVVLLAFPAFADQIDDAEAKKRGVPVERVQLDNEQAKSARLAAQVKQLQDQLEKLTKSMEGLKVSNQAAISAVTKERDAMTAALAELKSNLSPQQKKTLADTAKRIEDAIAAHTLCPGMTLEQARKSLSPSKESVQSEDATGQRMELVTTGQRGNFWVVTNYMLEMKDAKIASWSKFEDSQRLPDPTVPAEDYVPGKRVTSPPR